MKQIRISVRELVEFILRSGDLDSRKGGLHENAMLEGGRIHRMIQRRMGSEYQAEVGMKFREVTTDYMLLVEGRADGVIAGEERVTIDEIKGTYRDLTRMTGPEPVHLAQAKCYGAMWLVSAGKEQESICVRMTYCNMDTEEIRYFFEEYERQELEKWFRELITEYKKWVNYQVEWEKIREGSIKRMEFPYPYRKGQKELAADVYRTIYHGRKLFLEAPTGVGKTLSTCFPAIKAIGEGLSQRLFYLTAKTITRTAAEQTFSLLREGGLYFKTVTLTAKEKICFQEEVKCDPVSCPYAKGHFDRINDAMYELITKETVFTRPVIETYARAHTVCPFELALDVALFSDGVIGDYNYLFDPHVYLKRFFGQGEDGDSIILVDEAHNLVDRGRKMYSAELCKEDFPALKKIVKVYSVKIEKQLEKCNRCLLEMKRQTETVKRWEEEELQKLVRALLSLSSALSDYLENNGDSSVRDAIMDFYFRISHFLMMAESMEGDYVIYTELTESDNFWIRLFCVDPSRKLKACMDRGRSSILFSATLLPIQYYKQMLGGEETDYEVYAESSFDPSRCGLFIAGDVTSKYARRGRQEYEKIADYIWQIVTQRKGNYMVFFPSYRMLEEVYTIFQDERNQAGKVECICQQERMGEEAREEFLQYFTGKEIPEWLEQIRMPVEIVDTALIGFCIMGGIFSGGIDLKADSLIGVIVVGTGLPQVCAEQELLKNYFLERGDRGFDFAYRYPGMNKVLQAAGRVIRTAEDLGTVVLLDERFLEPTYTRLFPRQWKDYRRISIGTAAQEVEKFWNEWL